MRILRAKDRERYPELFDQMFRGRAAVFDARLRWPVTVENGREIDWYDRECDPIYVLDLDDIGQVRGSLRLLSSTGQTMLRREFADFFDEPVDVVNPLMWECTKFCVHGSGPGKTGASIRLLVQLSRLCMDFGITRVIGLYELQMERVYAGLGWEPTRLATSKPHLGKLGVGLWSVSAEVQSRLESRLSVIENTLPNAPARRRRS